MTRDELYQLAEGLLNECLDTLRCKGKDYAGTDDSLSNFKRNAERLGLTKYQVWSVYCGKHIDAIFNSIKADPSKPQVESEPLRGRIMDMIVYGILFLGMLEEDNKVDK